MIIKLTKKKKKTRKKLIIVGIIICLKLNLFIKITWKGLCFRIYHHKGILPLILNYSIPYQQYYYYWYCTIVLQLNYYNNVILICFLIIPFKQILYIRGNKTTIINTIRHHYYWIVIIGSLNQCMQTILQPYLILL